MKTQKNTKNPKKNSLTSISNKQKRQMIIVMMVIAVISILVISYIYIIPRTELTVKTIFNENFSGIAVGCKIKNSGNKDIDDFSIHMEIRNSTKGVMDELNFTRKSIRPGEEFDTTNLQFYGDQFETYTIILEIEFKSDGKSYKDTIKHTAKDYMNLTWDDKIT